MNDKPVAIPDWAEDMNQLHSRITALEAENARLRDAVRWAAENGAFNYEVGCKVCDKDKPIFVAIEEIDKTAYLKRTPFEKEILRRAGMEEGR